MATENLFDSVFFNVADKKQGLEGFLEEVFSFLDRRTDFFVRKEDASNKINALFERYHAKHTERLSHAQPSVPPKPEELEVEEPRVQEIFDDEDVQEITDIKENAVPSKEAVKPKSEEAALMSPNSGNGVTYENYSWTQTLSTLEISVPLKDFTNVRGKECRIEIGTDHLLVIVRGSRLLDDKLSDKVVIDDSFWVISDGNTIVITLEKINQMHWWNRCLQGEEKALDTSKVMPENSKLSDLDPETRQTVEKMMFEQREKQQGRIPQADLLRKFQQAHPEFDLSGVNTSFEH
eukprot:Gregarina_sp_Pseudo_9__472@NODE_1301_length_1702_cov_36_597715_g1222_i0_p1_GENE_NODE_1301_length_1702_cov_36_597715_g1222_i0NODE_1301_length_1702_cov_36_597715_g1222_i0_p1_ORF_typecomplete_len292_score51_83CS/PF04969_16/7_4e15Nudc_N/PF14050_6/6_1e13DUF3801/PF12687_7/0_023_NODE_1301_length_1702_cov_36_597715_g1222_i0110985